jgi:bacteriorhodopsin
LGIFTRWPANIWNAFMWGLLAYIYIWLVQMLWKVDPQAWLFLAAITTINLIFDFMAMAGSAGWTDVSVSFILNGLILLYVLLPGTRRAFGTEVQKK